MVGLLVVGTACGGRKNAIDASTWRQPVPDAPRIGVAPTQFVAHLAMPDAAPLDVFRANAWVGRIRFEGGYELLEEEGYQPRSVVVDLTARDAYEAQADRWLTDALQQAGDRADWTLVPLGDTDWVAAPSRSPQRGSSPFDGTDNVNLPRLSLRPAPADVPADLDVDLVLVPMVAHYYAHNAGWFVGQEIGSWSGARVRVLWALYEPGGGAPVAWGDIGTTEQEERLATPNRAQLEDLLIAVETDAARRLARQWRKQR